ncbi:MAG: MopE-related protein [Myxococcota bacterium]
MSRLSLLLALGCSGGVPDGEKQPVEGDDGDVCDRALVTVYRDADGDGFGDPRDADEVCEVEDGWVADPTDCDDADAAVNPEAVEVCDDADTDEDCSGAADDADPGVTDPATFYTDADDDGLGDAGAPVLACDLADGLAAQAGDCDDGDALVGGPPTWSRDLDGDGFGDPDDPVVQCEPIEGYVTNDDDCDDHDAEINPAGSEVCDDYGVDEDCDGLSGDDDPSLDTDSADYWHRDADGDGYGDAEEVARTCELPAGYVVDWTDCDDADAGTNPGASEVCNDGADNNCDSSANACGISTTTLSATGADYVAWGEAADDGAGWWVGFAGDWDGDGDDDVLVGAPGSDAGGTSSGAIYVLAGEATGSLDLSSAHAKIHGESSTDYLGASVAGVGDVDGDGALDLVAGGYGYQSSAGRAYLVYGPASGTEDVGDVAVTIEGSSAADYCGVRVAGGRDVSGDGRDDFAFGCLGDDGGASGAGAVYVITTAPTTSSYTSATGWHRLQGDVADGRAGYALAFAEDVDGDGADDVLVGAPEANMAYVVLGPVTGDADLSAADGVLDGASGDFGAAVAGLGDTDGDGYGDVAIGRPDGVSGSLSVGGVFVYTGGADAIVDGRVAELAGTPASTSWQEGASLAGAGDADGDGYDDLIVGAPAYTSGGADYGAAYLVLGPVVAGDLEDHARLRGDEDGDLAGQAVAGGGDFDGDGISDVVVGAPDEATGGSGAGAAYVLFGGGL